MAYQSKDYLPGAQIHLLCMVIREPNLCGTGVLEAPRLRTCAVLHRTFFRLLIRQNVPRYTLNSGVPCVTVCDCL